VKQAGRAASIDVDAVPLRAFGLADEHEPGAAPTHAHEKHQLLYADRGSLELTAPDGRWLLPPQRAAWIGAGVPHAVRFRSGVSLRTVYFDPALPLLPEVPCVVFAVTPLAREMILEAMRWGPARRAGSPLEEAFFQALGALAADWARRPLPFRLPAAKSPELARAMNLVLESLERMEASPTLEQAAKRANLSPRTLARRFQDEAQTSFRAFLQRARMMRATELLAEEGARVTDVALAVGFESPAAFTRAFEAFLGQRPRDYRQRRAPRAAAAEEAR
jgi:AraC-like DNA-binding protein